MTHSPILKVLSIFKKNKVKSLLIGGQACILYGAAEFSRDSDFMVLCDPRNLEYLKKALKELKTEIIYVPEFKEEYLRRGHACHFRCQAKGVEGSRVDLISKLKGCDEFGQLWTRRKKIKLKGAQIVDVIGLKDLVQCKKTQRDKDWLMLKRLIETDYFQNRNKADENKVRWWLLENRTPEHLLELAQKYPTLADECLKMRPLLSAAIAGNSAHLELYLHEEEINEQSKDKEYWTPLKKELELLRHQVLGKKKKPK